MNVASYHILYLSSQFPTLLHPQTGVFSLERVRALARAGCQIAVIAPVLMSPPSCTRRFDERLCRPVRSSSPR
jgi:hypothetical protein